MSNLIEVSNLCRQYPGFALRNVSFAVPGGTIMGFVGENGAGKTTTLKAILGLIRPDSGDCRILGQTMAEGDKALRRKVGVVFDETCFHENLTTGYIDGMLRRIYGADWDSAAFAALCQKFALPDKKEIKAYSRGMKMKLSIAAALAHHPQVLLLDEATSGLDPVVRDEILDAFYEFVCDDEHAVLLSSHLTTDLERVADYITYLHGGEIVFTENKDELLEHSGIARLTSAQFAALTGEQYLRRRQTPQGGTELLLNDRAAFARRHPEFVVDPAAIDDIMLFYAKGEAQ